MTESTKIARGQTYYWIPDSIKVEVLSVFTEDSVEKVKVQDGGTVTTLTKDELRNRIDDNLLTHNRSDCIGDWRE
jgi:hypothetical protein